MKPKISLFGTLFCIAIFLPSSLSRQEEEKSVPAQSRYSQVVDRAFQFSRGVPAEFQGVEYRIVVRYLPSFGATESQVVFLKKYDHTIRVVLYRLKPGARPISEVCNETLAKNPTASVNDILKKISVERIEEQLGTAESQLVNELFSLAIPTKLSTDLCMDGTIRELWVQTPSNEIHALFSECAYGESGDSAPIIRWMKTMQAQLQEQKRP